MPWPTDDPEKYFEDRGFVLFVIKAATEADYSADLLSADRRLCLQWRYGSGATAEEAAQSALRRYHVEEEPDPPLPRRLP
jgi:hypothetical protein